MTNDERNNLRKTIKAHPMWKSYAKANGLTLANLSNETQGEQICRALGIDMAEAKKGHASAPSKPEPKPEPDWTDAQVLNWIDHNINLATGKSDLTARDLVGRFEGLSIQEAGKLIERAEGMRMVTPPEPSVTPPEPAIPPAKPEPKPAASEHEAIAALRALLGNAVSPDEVQALVTEAMRPYLTKIETLEAPKPVLHVVEPGGALIGKAPATRHRNFDMLVKIVTARDPSGHRLNAWMTGPAGSGKTFAAKMLAEALGLEFRFHGAMTMPHELLGFVDGHGHYHVTPFVETFRNGGVILLDETDAGTNEALLTINAATANGSFSSPTGEIIARHPDCVILAAANTWGLGGTSDYVGRARIDAAILDRFCMVDWDYDESLERKLSGNPDWCARVQKARAQARQAGLKVVISPRASINGAALIANGMTEAEAASVTYLKGLTPAQVAQIEARPL